MKLKGVGKSIGAKIDEFLTTGVIAAAVEVMESAGYQAEKELQMIIGVGPTAARKLMDMGITTVAGVRGNETALALLSEESRAAVPFTCEFMASVPRAEADQFQAALTSAAKDLDGIGEAELLGGYRRGSGALEGEDAHMQAMLVATEWTVSRPDTVPAQARKAKIGALLSEFLDKLAETDVEVQVLHTKDNHASVAIATRAGMAAFKKRDAAGSAGAEDKGDGAAAATASVPSKGKAKAKAAPAFGALPLDLEAAESALESSKGQPKKPAKSFGTAGRSAGPQIEKVSAEEGVAVAAAAAAAGLHAPSGPAVHLLRITVVPSNSAVLSRFCMTGPDTYIANLRALVKPVAPRGKGHTKADLCVPENVGNKYAEGYKLGLYGLTPAWLEVTETRPRGKAAAEDDDAEDGAGTKRVRGKIQLKEMLGDMVDVADEHDMFKIIGHDYQAPEDRAAGTAGEASE